MRKLLLVILAVLTAPVFANADRAATLKAEFERMLAFVQSAKPDGKVGDFMSSKKMGHYEILWDLGATADDYDLIRLFRSSQDDIPSFSIDYYRSREIVPGRRVVRRVVGPIIRGWRNDTMDYDTGEYLGSQGVESPSMSAEDHQIAREWGIKLFWD